VNDSEHKVSGLAAIYYEPLWIFVRRGIRIEDKKIAYREGSVAVGPMGSGTEAVAKAIIAEQGYDITSPALVNLTSAEARRQLMNGALDVAFFVTSYRDPGIMELMRRKDLQLTSFRREAAYTRKFRGLTPLRLPEGLLDLRDNIPPENVTLLSPSAMLVAREDINPRVVELVLKVAQAVHNPGSLIDPPLKLLILPLVAVWVPLLRIAPMIADWRKQRWLKRYYDRLRKVEDELATARWPNELREGINELEALRGEVQAVSGKLPLQQQQDVYH